MLNVVRDGYRPFQVVALGESGIDGAQSAPARQLPSNGAGPVGSIAAVPLLQGRWLVDGQAAAYVCRDFACRAPITEVEALPAQLE